MSIVCNTKRPAWRHGSRGFTLVELLVVVVIIATLAALGFMGGNKILQSSRENTAISNLRQLGQGLMTIQADDPVFGDYRLSGSYPAEAGYSERGVCYTWVYAVAELLELGEFDKDGWGAKFRWHVDPNQTVFHDPTADWEIEDNGNAISRAEGSLWKTSHFGYNSYLGSFINGHRPTYERGKGDYESDGDKVMDLTTDPSILIMVAQMAGSDSRSDIEAGMPGHRATNGSLYLNPWSKNTAIRIRGGAHCVFADGHIGWVNTRKLNEGSWDCPNIVPDSTKPRKKVN